MREDIEATSHERTQPIKWALLGAALVGIALVTLTPGEGKGHPAFQWRPNHRPEHLVEDALNVLLFVPLGTALGWFGIGAARALLVSAAASGAIEITQRFLIQGRSGALDDILMNALGGFLGALLFARLTER